jgi:hypothetical protein
VTTFVADLQVRDFRPDLDDLAGCLVADDVRAARHLAAAAIERVAALDADRLDADDHALRMDGGSATSS